MKFYTKNHCQHQSKKLEATIKEAFDQIPTPRFLKFVEKVRQYEVAYRVAGEGKLDLNRIQQAVRSYASHRRAPALSTPVFLPANIDPLDTNLVSPQQQADIEAAYFAEKLWLTWRV
jgi:hypothetical protein